MKTLIDLVLGRYGKHPCVIGFGVDVEWHKEADRPEWGVPVDDAMGRQWEAWVKAHDPAYRLFIKHWDQRWLCPTYRGDIVFVDDSQIVESADVLVKEFEAWGKFFYPNPVMFQIGYPSDRPGGASCPSRPRRSARPSRPGSRSRAASSGSTSRSGKSCPSIRSCRSPCSGSRSTSTPGLSSRSSANGASSASTRSSPARRWRETRDFRALLRTNAIALFIIYPVFQNPEALKARPGLAAVTSEGLNARDEWVEFVCPSREDFVREKADHLRELVAACDPEAVSLDFIRYFVFWEKVYPDRSPASLPQTCFCPGLPRALLPGDGHRHPGRARRGPGRRPLDPRDARGRMDGLEMRRHRPGRRDPGRGRPPVEARGPGQRPCRPLEGGRLRRGRPGRRRPGRGPPFAPRPISFRPWPTITWSCGRPAWVHEVVADLAARSRAPVLPSIQVAEAYIDKPLPPEEFRSALEEALKPPSLGVVLWSWDALSKSAEKKAIFRSVAALKKTAR